MEQGNKKVVFLGSKPIGYECLSFLLENNEKLGVDVIGVLTNDNQRFGSGFSIIELANGENCKVFKDLNELLTIEDIDYLISVQYHQILRKEHIERAQRLAINLHMAPLPEYRGCNQFSFAIYNESKIFGTTLHRLEPGIDDGDIIAESRFPIEPNMLVHDLYQKTYSESIMLFKDNIPKILSGEYSLTSQDSLREVRGSNIYFRKDISNLKEINLNDSEDEVIRKVRATSMPGFEPAYTIVQNRKYYIIPQENYTINEN